MPSGMIFESLYMRLAGSYFSLLRLPLGVSMMTLTSAGLGSCRSMVRPAGLSLTVAPGLLLDFVRFIWVHTFQAASVAMISQTGSPGTLRESGE